MNRARLIGITLILIGITGLVIGRFTYTKDKSRVDLGPVGIEVRDRQTVHIPPLLAGLSLAGGVVLTAAAGGRRA